MDMANHLVFETTIIFRHHGFVKRPTQTQHMVSVVQKKNYMPCLQRQAQAAVTKLGVGKRPIKSVIIPAELTSIACQHSKISKHLFEIPPTKKKKLTLNEKTGQKNK